MNMDIMLMTGKDKTMLFNMNKKLNMGISGWIERPPPGDHRETFILCNSARVGGDGSAK